MSGIVTQLVEFIKSGAKRGGVVIRNSDYSPATLDAAFVDARDNEAIMRYMNDEARMQAIRLHNGEVISIFVIHKSSFQVQHWQVYGGTGALQWSQIR